MVASWLLMRAFLPPRSLGVLVVGLLTFILGFAETVVVVVAVFQLCRQPATRNADNILHVAVGMLPVLVFSFWIGAVIFGLAQFNAEA